MTNYYYHAINVLYYQLNQYTHPYTHTYIICYIKLYVCMRAYIMYT